MSENTLSPAFNTVKMAWVAGLGVAVHSPRRHRQGVRADDARAELLSDQIVPAVDCH